MAFDSNKYEEVASKRFPKSYKPSTGIEVVIFHYDDPEKTRPQLSIREYYTDDNGTVKVLKGKSIKIDWNILEDLIKTLTNVANDHQQKQRGK